MGYIHVEFERRMCLDLTPFEAHLLEAKSRSLIRNMLCDSHHIYSFRLEGDLSISGLSLKKKSSFSCSHSPPNTCIMHSSFQNDFICIILFGSQCAVAEGKLDLSQGTWIVVWTLPLVAGDLGWGTSSVWAAASSYVRCQCENRSSLRSFQF